VPIFVKEYLVMKLVNLCRGETGIVSHKQDGGNKPYREGEKRGTKAREIG